MPDLSTYLRNALYNVTVRGVAFTPPARTYLALLTGPTLADEVAAGGYARQPLTMGAPTAGDGSNASEATFGPLDGSDTVTHAALFDAATGGHALTVVKALAAPRTWQDGDTIFFQAGDVQFAIA